MKNKIPPIEMFLKEAVDNVLYYPSTFKKVYPALTSNDKILSNTIQNSATPYEPIYTLKFDNGVEEIPEKICYNCELIKKVIIPSSVKTIGSGAFLNCSCLKEIEWDGEPQLEVIKDSAFQCTAIESMTIPETVTFIGVEAFSSCSHLIKIVFPKKIISIPKHCCSFCPDLESVVFNGEVEAIEPQAFRMCALSTFPFGKSLKEIGIGAFSNNRFETLDLSDTQVSIIQSMAFSNNMISNIIPPKYLVAIGEFSFEKNSIPEEVSQKLKDIAFFTDTTAFINQDDE